ncbi:MAG: hemerythrin domain-containing protein [Oligoflexia bacterium]|nr:hemerythrin domain-containing protein [Oligoflexia bacterium]
MNTIFKTLRRDHEVQRELLDKLVDTSGDTARRREMLSILSVELKKHAKFEERSLYKKLLTSDLTQSKTRHSVSEHEEIDEILEELSNIDFSSPAWLSKCKELKEKVSHHLDEEEDQIFLLAGKVLTREEKRDLSKIYLNGVSSEFRA